MFTRRDFLHTASGAGAMVGLSSLLPAWAQDGPGFDAQTGLSGTEFDLTIAETPVTIDGRRATATTINGTIPGPILRFREGDTVTIRVTNKMDVDTSIHWHGIILPANMDGVPEVSYPGIFPGETFTYRYTLGQAGTYWYHSHTRFQEQTGMYGPLIIDPAGEDPVKYDREHVVQLSDWTFEDPDRVFDKLKKSGHYYNFNERTIGDFFDDIGEMGLGGALKDRMSWGRMRMAATDIADVTGYTYTYLLNGRGPETNWTGLFKPGERVRLRFINSSAMTFFNVRIPGLKMTVVQADGQNVKPVDVDEFQIAVAETFDVVVEPEEDKAFTIFAESLDRSGYARGTLAPRLGMTAPVPELRERPLRTMKDMGMAMSGMSGMDGMSEDKDMAGMDHEGGMDMHSQPEPVTHDHPQGPGVANVAEMAQNRLHEPGTGLKDVGHRVLVYTDLESLEPWERRAPTRELELHLTGNMERYMWSFDGKKFTEVDGPIPFTYGERVRLTFVNDTMMEHPIHLHGMWMEIDTGAGNRIPRKHTISVKPAEKLSVEIEADAEGDWAFHCHFLYHMEGGMFRVVRVSRDIAEVDHDNA